MTRLFALVLSAVFLMAAACSNPADKEIREAATVRIAVATNFKPVMAALKTRFEAESWFEVEYVSGSTGALYTQITQGAPFDVLLAADQARPEKLEANGQGIAQTRMTYALGQLVLWRAGAGPVSPDALREAATKVAIANPDLAPYGRAAQEVLTGLELDAGLQDRGVLGTNVGQAFTFVKTGNAEFGFVALAQVLSLPEREQGAYWSPPQEMYAPIRQDAILLAHGADKEAASAFMAFLESETARDIIAASGYGLP